MRKVLKNAEIVAIVNGISEMRNRESKLTEAKLPIKVNFALNKNFKRLMKEIEPYEDSRKEILRKYNNPRAKEGEIDILPKHRKKYESEIKELIGIENEVEIHTVSLEEIEKCSNLLIADLEALDFMILEKMESDPDM